MYTYRIGATHSRAPLERRPAHTFPSLSLHVGRLFVFAFDTQRRWKAGGLDHGDGNGETTPVGGCLIHFMYSCNCNCFSPASVQPYVTSANSAFARPIGMCHDVLILPFRFRSCPNSTRLLRHIVVSSRPSGQVLALRRRGAYELVHLGCRICPKSARDRPPAHCHRRFVTDSITDPPSTLHLTTVAHCLSLRRPWLRAPGSSIAGLRSAQHPGRAMTTCPGRDPDSCSRFASLV